MSKQTDKHKIIFLSFITTLLITAVNLGSAMTVYSLIASNILINDQSGQAGSRDGYDIDKEYERSLPLPSNAADPTNGDLTLHIPQNIVSPPTRNPHTPIIIGEPPRPTTVITSEDNRPIYLWCSGTNPNLPDGVCKAIISIAANPTASNPHLSPQVIQWLSLLPPNSTMTISEESWVQTNSSGGQINVILQTSDYGDIPLLITLEYQDPIWIVAEGRTL